MARIVAGSERRLGIIPAGLQNNFARSLGIPLDVEEALQAVLHPDTGKVTLGRIGSSTFIEAGSVGVFGDLIALGEEARQLRFGELVQPVDRELALVPPVRVDEMLEAVHGHLAEHGGDRAVDLLGQQAEPVLVVGRLGQHPPEHELFAEH